jgi:hypothetical protein
MLTRMDQAASQSACSVGAILFYWPRKPAVHATRRTREMRNLVWMMFQMANIGPIFGQVGFFYKSPAATRTNDHCTAMPASRRLLGVLNDRLGADAGRSVTTIRSSTWPSFPGSTARSRTTSPATCWA